MIRFTPTLAVAAVLASSRLLAAPELAPDMNPPEGERLAFALQAQGVQIYACRQDPRDAYAYQWTFVAPEATLSEAGKAVARHGAGPSWTSTTDGSTVKGVVRAKQDGGAGNIPWLLLAGEAGGQEGRFAGITSVQRVATRGGVEPREICDSARAGQESRVPYTAEYRFFKRG